MFNWLKNAMRYPCILRSYSGESSSGNKIYENPILCMCYPFTDNTLSEKGISKSITDKTKLYLSAKIPIKAEDIIILDCVYPNNTAKVFNDIIERDLFYEENPKLLIEDTSWCVINDVIWIYNKDKEWTDNYKWEECIDGEHIENFKGKQDIVSNVIRHFDAFNWNTFPDNNNDLLLQELVI